MIDLITYEFKMAGYGQLSDRIWKHKEYNDFWMIYPICGLYDVEELQEQVYSNLEIFRKKFPESEKSFSLLILQQIEEEKMRNHQKVIDDENDIYYFKKYVIQYTDDEWKAAQTLTDKDFKGLGELLMRTSVFELVKKDENSPFNLLYTIAHKLPFVMMHVERKEYDPNPVISISPELQPLFEWIESLPDMEDKNPSNDELQAAHYVIDQLINEYRHE